MKQTSITSILTGCSLLLTCCLTAHSHATTPPSTMPNTMRIEGYGEIELIGAKWSEPFDAAKVRQCMKAVSEWHRGKLFDPFRVMVFPEHELVKSKRNGPAVVIRPESQPDAVFWLTLKDNGKKILIETPSTAAMRLVAPPPGKTLDLGFADPFK